MGLFDSIKNMIAPESDGQQDERDIYTVEPATDAPSAPEKDETEQQHWQGDRPQDDVPAEVITHYIVKDYQRMWHAYFRYKQLAEATQNQIEDKVNKKVKNAKDTISKLRETVRTMRDETKQHEATMELQRTQIRTLMDKLEELEQGDREDGKAWHTDRWIAAIEQIDKLQKQLTTVRGIVTAQDIETAQMNIITNLIEDCKRQAVRIRESVAHTAPSKVRMAFKATSDNSKKE